MNFQLLYLIILSCFLMGCASSSRDQSYLQEYGHQGGRGQGFRLTPHRGEKESHTCLSGEVSGRINRIIVESLASGLEPGLGLDVQTPDRGLVHVHVGPLSLLDRQESDLKPGDTVTLQAFCYNLAGQERLLASEIKHGEQSLNLRDAQGNLYWGNGRKQRNLL